MLHDASGDPTVFQAALGVMRARGVRLICFDFGGTLVNFEPIHRAAFLEALGISDGSREARVLDAALRVAVRKGEDSYEMAKAILLSLGSAARDDVDSLVVRKRALVERRLLEVTLEPLAREMVREACRLGEVCILSLGLVSSMEAVIHTSLGEDACGISVYGRRFIDSRVDKASLLRRVIADKSVEASGVLYVGDAEVDQRIAIAVGVQFLRVAPFGV